VYSKGKLCIKFLQALKILPVPHPTAMREFELIESIKEFIKYPNDIERD